MAAEDEQLDLTVLSMSGDVIARFAAAGSWTVAQTARRVAEMAPSPACLQYRLMRGMELLLEGSTLREAVGSGKAVLTACLLPVVKLTLPGVSGAAMLPGSGDCIIATSGGLGPEPPARAVGVDEGAESPMWVWRLKASAGWSPQAAVLVARLRCITEEQLRMVWQQKREMFLEGEELEYLLPFTPAQLEAGDEHGIPWPSEMRVQPYLHAHDDRYVVFAWNEYVSGRGRIDRLDVESGEVAQLASVHDVWAVTTDPRDGRIFCTTCYDGTDILQIRESTVYNPSATSDTQNHYIVAQPCPPAMEFGVAFHAGLGALVALGRGGGVVYMVCPPGSAALAAASSQEGAEVIDGLRRPEDDITPGDRTSPWVCVRLRRSEALPASDTRGPGADWATCFVAAHGDRVTFLEPSQQREVRSFELLRGAGAGAAISGGGAAHIVATGSRVLAFAGAVGSEHPVLVVNDSA